ncbi:hypothetical protein Dimus_014049 [Dionaea muscipula]
MGSLGWPPPLQQSNFHDHQYQTREEGSSGNDGLLYVKVMTDEQLEILRIQIAVYTTICEQLVELHKSITAQQDLGGVRLGNLFCDPLMTPLGHKITARQRWTPTAVQLQILERIFDQGTGTPSKQKIKEITAELSQHGQIAEANVYNWFQNRRARSKRKQQNAGPNNGESEVDTDAESPKEKKAKPEKFQSFQCQHGSALGPDELRFHSQEITSEMHNADLPTTEMDPLFPSGGSSKPFEFRLGIDHLLEKMDMPGSYHFYQHPEDYSMTG